MSLYGVYVAFASMSLHTLMDRSTRTKPLDFSQDGAGVLEHFQSSAVHTAYESHKWCSSLRWSREVVLPKPYMLLGHLAIIAK
jgi:hypothetical protein